MAPLVCIVFQTRYAIPDELRGHLVLLNFVTQLITDIVAVVLGTTLIVAQVGRAAWQILPVMWAIVPLINLVMFSAGRCRTRCLRTTVPASDTHWLVERCLSLDTIWYTPPGAYNAPFNVL